MHNDTSKAVIVHECTGGFLRWVLTRFLPEWDWHCLLKNHPGQRLPEARTNDSHQDAFLLSPDMFGWPLVRPRLFEVGTLRDTCFLAMPETINSEPERNESNESSFSDIGQLFCECKLDCGSLLVAPEDIGQQTVFNRARDNYKAMFVAGDLFFYQHCFYQQLTHFRY